jgi:Ca2+/Na+ antiporter
LTATAIFSTASLKRQIVMALVAWLLLVTAMTALFRSWWVLELYLFPSIVFVWMLRNEDRLKKTRPDLKPLRPSVRFHFFFTVPLLVGVRLAIDISRAVREPDACRLVLAMSFGLSVIVVIIYAFGIVSRKKANGQAAVGSIS